jgi:glucosamine 6-phosphate synthetase-like amidotransferase/phosphosugar isomerase protein
MVEKQGFKHFMLKEIYEQPGVVPHLFRNLSGHRLECRQRCRPRPVEPAR